VYPSFNPRALGLSLPAAEAIELAAEAGFPAVDLLVRDLVERGEPVADLRRRMDDLGLRGGAWPLPVRWKDDEATYAADLRALPRLAETAAALGLLRTGTWVLPEAPAPGEPHPAGAPSDPEALLAWHLDRLLPIAGILHDHGTRLGLEVIGVESFRAGRGRPFVCRLGDVSPLLDALDTFVPGAVGIVADVFHLHAAGEGLDTALLWGPDRIVWAHVADLPRDAPPDRAAIRDDDRDLPGAAGAVPVARFLAALARHGYRGPVTPEPLAGCRSLIGLDPRSVAVRTADALRSVWPGASDQASAVIA
jgi:sugar phosphate isomerase/epimerase